MQTGKVWPTGSCTQRWMRWPELGEEEKWFIASSSAWNSSGSCSCKWEGDGELALGYGGATSESTRSLRRRMAPCWATITSSPRRSWAASCWRRAEAASLRRRSWRVQWLSTMVGRIGAAELSSPAKGGHHKTATLQLLLKSQSKTAPTAMQLPLSKPA